MGSGEDSTPAKPSKPTATTQETPTTPSYPDWSTPLQAYYGPGTTPPAPFFASPVASSPTPHPYLWGSQHLIPSYGTPLAYPALYPHGGLYAHPNMAMAQGAPPTTTEMEGKAPNGKDRTTMKKSKGSSGNTPLVGGKSGESGKAASGSGNDGASESAESGSEGSSDASDENTNQQELSGTKKRSFDQMLVDGANAQNNSTAQYSAAAVESSFSARGQPAANLPVSVPGKSAVSMPTTNLNIGMDLWNPSPAGGVPMKARPNASGVSSTVAPAPVVGREGVAPEHLWIQDERELKRQRRKQSNRESARRSRLRKQAECEELQTKVEALSNENHTLRNELQRLAEECTRLTSENNSIVDELTRLYGPEAIANLEGNNTNMILQSTNGEEHGHGQDTSMGDNSVSSQKNGDLFNSNKKLDSGSN